MTHRQDTRDNVFNVRTGTRAMFCCYPSAPCSEHDTEPDALKQAVAILADLRLCDCRFRQGIGTDHQPSCIELARRRIVGVR